MGTARHLTTAELETGLDEIRQSPLDGGVLRLIVRRPAADQREVLEVGQLDVATGLVGDCWNVHRSAHPDTQLNVMNARAIALIAQDPHRWSLAGDQLYIDLDLSIENLPPGTQLAIGAAQIEVTPQPHTGCRKFRERYGVEAMRFVNSPVGRQLNLRGINAKVIQSGVIRVGEVVNKVG